MTETTPSPATAEDSSPARMRLTRLWWLAPIMAICVAYRGTWNYGYIADAVFLLQENNTLVDLSTWWDTLTHDYFWSSSGNTIPYWRPGTKITWLLEAQAAGVNPVAFHGFHLLWFLVAVGGVMAITRTLGASRAWACVAGLLFGLHPTAQKAVCLLMARSDVMSVAGCLWAVTHWLRWRQGRSRDLILHILWLIVALSTKESSIFLAPLLTLWVLTPSGAECARPPRMIQIAPVWCASILMLALRSNVLDAHPSVGVVFDPWRIATGTAHYLMALWPFQFDTGLDNMTYAQAQASWLTTAGVLLAALLLLVACLRKRRHELGLLLIWIGGVLAPVLLVAEMNVPNVVGKFAMADRWAMAAAAPACIFFAMAGSRWLKRRGEPLLVGGAAIWALVAAFLLPGSHGVYANALTLLDHEDAQYLRTPAAYRTPEDDCRHHERSIARAAATGESAQVLSLDRTYPAHCERTAKRQFNRLAALVDTRQFSEANQLARELLANEGLDTRERPALYHLAGVALLQSAQPGRALGMFDKAEALGFSSCSLYQQAAGAAITLKRWKIAAQRLEAFEGCVPLADTDPQRSDLLVDAARAWRNAGNEPKARELLSQALTLLTPEMAGFSKIQSMMMALEPLPDAVE